MTAFEKFFYITISICNGVAVVIMTIFVANEWIQGFKEKHKTRSNIVGENADVSQDTDYKLARIECTLEAIKERQSEMMYSLKRLEEKAEDTRSQRPKRIMGLN